LDAYLLWQQLSQPLPPQQSLHLSVQQDWQQWLFPAICEVCANAATVRTTATDRTAKIRFMEISLTLKTAVKAWHADEHPRPLRARHVRRCLDPKDSKELVEWRMWRWSIPRKPAGLD
jgi:hypothetical protein